MRRPGEFEGFERAQAAYDNAMPEEPRQPGDELSAEIYHRWVYGYCLDEPLPDDEEEGAK